MSKSFRKHVEDYEDQSHPVIIKLKKRIKEIDYHRSKLKDIPDAQHPGAYRVLDAMQRATECE